MDISFIIPVYNSEVYLTECLDSILAQIGIEKEIIIIDDGSTDNSLTIAESYRDVYENIIIIFQRNLGPGYARNSGIKQAKGDYIWFIDSDDYLPNENIAFELYKIAKERNCEIIKGTYEYYYQNSKEFKYPKSHNKIQNIIDQNMTGESYLKFCVSKKYVETLAWLSIIKREYIIKNNIFFETDILWEDFLYWIKLLSSDAKVRIIQTNINMYVYRMRDNSITHDDKHALVFINSVIRSFEIGLFEILPHTIDNNIKENIKKILTRILVSAFNPVFKLPRKQRLELYGLFKNEYLLFVARYPYRLQDTRRAILFLTKKYLKI